MNKDSNQLTLEEFEDILSNLIEDVGGDAEVTIGNSTVYLNHPKVTWFLDGSKGWVFTRGGDDLRSADQLFDCCINLEEPTYPVYVMTEDELSVSPIVGLFKRKDSTIEVVLH